MKKMHLQHPVFRLANTTSTSGLSSPVYLRNRYTATFILFLFFTLCSPLLHAQGVSVNEDGSAPDPSAILEAKSANKGFLPPRLTTVERDAITNAVEGLTIYNTTTKCTEVFDGTEWKGLCGGQACTPEPPASVAGLNQLDVCIPANLQANDAGSGNTGTWSIASGSGGSFADANNPTSSFTGTPGELYALRWTISNACGSSTDGMYVRFEPLPTAAQAGPDQLNLLGSSAVLAANAAGQNETGTWSIVSGSGGSFADIHDPATTFTGASGGAYTLRWTISRNCTDSQDETSITFSCPQVGDTFDGGIVFYTDGNCHGLIAAASDNDGAWGCEGTSIGTSSSIFSGQSNTTAIVNGCATPNIAARVCDNLEQNGYTDWFLPSKDELNQMYLNKAAVGINTGCCHTYYWSSTEFSSQNAYLQSFLDGSYHSSPNHAKKTSFGTYSFRCVRAY